MNDCHDPIGEIQTGIAEPSKALNAHANASHPNSLNELKVCLHTRTWVIGCSSLEAFQRLFEIAVSHGCTVFRAMVPKEHRLEWYYSLLLLKHHAWREPWPCRIVHHPSIGKQAAEHPGSPTHVPFCQSIRMAFEPGLGSSMSDVSVLRSDRSAAACRHDLPKLQSSFGKRGVFLQVTTCNVFTFPCKVCL